MIKINLLPPEERALRSYTVRWEFLIGVFGIALLLVITGYSFIQSQSVKSLDQEYNSLVQHNQLLQQQKSRVDRLRDEVEQLEQISTDYGSLLLHKEQSRLVENLIISTDGMPEDLWLERLTYRSGVWQLAGYSGSLSTLSQYVAHLRAAGMDANILTFHRDSAISLVTFSLESKGGGMP